MFPTVKKMLKKFLPPPTNSFMREVTIMKQKIDVLKDQLTRQDELTVQLLNKLSEQNDRLSNLRNILESNNRQLDEQSALFMNKFGEHHDHLINLYSFTESINRQQNEWNTQLMNKLGEQNERLGSLHSFLESINRENLRQYFESHAERIDIKEQYLVLTQRLRELETSKTLSE